MMTPSEIIMSRSTEHRSVTDGLGRIIHLRRLTAIDTLRLLKVAGPALSENHVWLDMAAIAYSVVSIDGVPIPLPANEAQIEAVVQRLGDDGMTAAAGAFDDIEAGSVDSAGNSFGTPA
jgi:hypothetical protein